MKQPHYIRQGFKEDRKGELTQSNCFVFSSIDKSLKLLELTQLAKDTEFSSKKRNTKSRDKKSKSIEDTFGVMGMKKMMKGLQDEIEGKYYGSMVNQNYIFAKTKIGESISSTGSSSCNSLIDVTLYDLNTQNISKIAPRKRKSSSKSKSMKVNNLLSQLITIVNESPDAKSLLANSNTTSNRLFNKLLDSLNAKQPSSQKQPLSSSRERSFNPWTSRKHIPDLNSSVFKQTKKKEYPSTLSFEKTRKKAKKTKRLNLSKSSRNFKKVAKKLDLSSADRTKNDMVTTRLKSLRKQINKDSMVMKSLVIKRKEDSKEKQDKSKMLNLRKYISMIKRNAKLI